jgi:hypothetical protein
LRIVAKEKRKISPQREQRRAELAENEEAGLKARATWKREEK